MLPARACEELKLWPASIFIDQPHALSVEKIEGKTRVSSFFIRLRSIWVRAPQISWALEVMMETHKAHEDTK